MPDMEMGPTLPRLTWHVFFTSWDVQPGWYLVILAALLAYCYGVARVRRSSSPSIHPARVVSFVAGLVVLVLSLSTAVETYSHILFWMHMVQHLLLIMVVPALLVVGQPLTVLVACTGGPVRSPIARVLHSGPAAVLTHPLTGLVLYTAIIVGTHLTSFMDQMATSSWLHPAEQVLYLAGGYLFLLPVLGNEPIRWRPPHLVRMVVLFIAMAPDTVVGIVLLQTPHNLFPAMTADRPTWTLGPVDDLNTGGGIMWAFGDGLMMLLIVAVMLAYLSHSASNATAGTWLEGVRRQTLARNLGYASDREPVLDHNGDVDDDDELLEAYNQMLRRMNKQDQAQ
jgi:cytochrome c oxidase assembly factor CtaG